MYLTIIIFLFFAWRLLLDYNRGVLLITAWVLVLDILKLPGGMFTIFQLLAFLACVVGIYRYINTKKKINPYPFWGCAIAIIISISITNIFSLEHHFPMCIKDIIIPLYIFPFCVWNALDKPYNMRIFVKYTMIFLVLVVGYGLYETITTSNPIMDWLTANNITTNSVGLSDRFRFGLKRIQSFLAYNGALGACCIMNALFLIYVNTRHKSYIQRYSNIVPWLVIGLYLCTLFTGSRAVILATIVGSLYFARGSIMKYKWTWFVIILAIIVIPFVFSYFVDISHAFSDTKSVGGSNTEMRQVQFDLAFYFFGKSPWYGNGFGYTMGYVVEHYNKMKGAESIWIPLMIEQGIIGMVAYLMILFIPFRYCLKLKNYVGIFIILAFITAKTLSSIPGMSAAYFLIYVIATSRLILYQREQNIQPLYEAYETS